MLAELKVSGPHAPQSVEDMRKRSSVSNLTNDEQNVN